MNIEEIMDAHETEAAMDICGQYSQWSQPALAGRLREAQRHRAWLLEYASRTCQWKKEGPFFRRCDGTLVGFRQEYCPKCGGKVEEKGDDV